PARSPRFPYPTLFRSTGGAAGTAGPGRSAFAYRGHAGADRTLPAGRGTSAGGGPTPAERGGAAAAALSAPDGTATRRLPIARGRSEEHTSELQSPYDL